MARALRLGCRAALGCRPWIQKKRHYLDIGLQGGGRAAGLAYRAAGPAYRAAGLHGRATGLQGCGRAAGPRQGCRAAAGLRQGCGKVVAGLPGLLALGFGQAGRSQAKSSAEPRPTGRQEQDLGWGRGAGALDVHEA